MSTKKPCKNHPSFTFSGKESSPLGLGYTAEAEDPGTVMEGRDKTMWMVGIRNGVKIWNRIPTQIVANVTKAMEKDQVVMPAEPPAAQEPTPVKEEVEPVVDEPKKRAPRKKKEVAPAPELAPPAEVVIAPPVEEAPKEVKKRAAPRKKKEEVAPAPAAEEVVEEAPKEDKKRAAPRKKKAEAPEAAPPQEAAEPKKKAPNDFNIYVSYRTDQLKKENPSLDHKERFKQASVDWKEIDPSKKQAIIEAARAWVESNKK